MKKSRTRLWLALGALVLFGVAVIVAVPLLGLSPSIKGFVQGSPSMAPALMMQDRFLVGPAANLRAGDVVLFVQTDGLEVAKRVVGMPGDLVEVGDEVRRNGESLSTGRTATVSGAAPMEPDARCYEERIGEVTYATIRSGTSSVSPAVTVPPNHVYVLGDYRSHSNDSRFFGPVPIANIRGKVTGLYWRSTPRMECRF